MALRTGAGALKQIFYAFKANALFYAAATYCWRISAIADSICAQYAARLKTAL